MKKLLLCILTIICFSSIAYAENPAAEKYRNLFNDGKVSMRYEYTMYTDKGKKFYEAVPHYLQLCNGNRSATDNNMRRLAQLSKESKEYYNDTFKYINGDIYVIAKLDHRLYDYCLEKKSRQGHDPEGFYDIPQNAQKNINYYALRYNPQTYMISKDACTYNGNNLYRQLILLWEALSDLRIPIELSVFYRDDLLAVSDDYSGYIYNGGFGYSHRTEPIFLESSKKNIDNIDYECDRYLVNVIDDNGGLVDELAYDLLYKNGELKISQCLSISSGERMVEEHVYSELSNNVQENRCAIEQSTLLFEVATDNNDADMNTLMTGKTPKLRFVEIAGPKEVKK